MEENQRVITINCYLMFKNLIYLKNLFVNFNCLIHILTSPFIKEYSPKIICKNERDTLNT